MGSRDCIAGHRIGIRPTGNDPADEPGATFTRFIHRPRWFVLSQTDGADYTPVQMPTWNEARALEQLAITRIDFSATDGNVQGFARGRGVAVSPVAALPHKTLFHELAHVVVGHTAEGTQEDDEQTPRSLREVEAESVALLCCAALELPWLTYARGYIQHWHASGQPIPEKSAARIFKAADAILRAGQAETDTSPEEGA